MTKRWLADVKEDPVTGDGIIEFPPEMLEETGWKEGDELVWTDNKDGSFTLTKKETQWVLVEAVSTFRMRYMVEVPVGTDNFGKDKSEWALDTVTMNEAEEFSQEHLGEQIVSHRVVTKEEALALCDQDNDYTKSWPDDKKIETFFTTWKKQNDN
jgi:bifunctional DNA-binding transcriptional regulator/antitoxin component of YhaV-PrlF toxin-antitoxin module